MVNLKESDGSMCIFVCLKACVSVFVYAYRVKMHSTINRSGVSVIIVCVRLCVRVLVRLGSV